MLVFILQNKLVFYDRKPRDTVIPVIRQFFLRLSGANFQTDLKGKQCGIIKKNDKRKKLEKIWTVEQLWLPKNNRQKEEIMRLIFKLSFLEQKRKWLTLDVKTRLLEERLLLSFFLLNPDFVFGQRWRIHDQVKKKKFKQHVQHAFLCRTLRLFLLYAVSPWRQLEPTMPNYSFFIVYVQTV